MAEITKIGQSPEFVAEQVDKINEIIDALRPLLNLEAGAGIAITPSDASIKIDVISTAGGGIPSGSAGDMLYHDGSNWVLLQAPTVSVADPVLRHNGTNPYWEEPESC